MMRYRLRTLLIIRRRQNAALPRAPMLRYKLRTLLIALAIGPMVLASGYWAWLAYNARSYVREIVSYYGTGDRHKTMMYLPSAKSGYHWQQGRDGAATEVPDDPE
jgi:hypothetical protein